MEEGCEYLGEIIYEAPSGETQSAEYCQDLCPLFGCTYWSYDGNTKACILYDSEDRVCQGLGGGQEPSIQGCMGTICFNLSKKCIILIPSHKVVHSNEI